MTKPEPSAVLVLAPPKRFCTSAVTTMVATAGVGAEATETALPWPPGARVAVLMARLAWPDEVIGRLLVEVVLWPTVLASRAPPPSPTASRPAPMATRGPRGRRAGAWGGGGGS